MGIKRAATALIARWPVIGVIARIGYGARGVLYIMVGVLAAGTALGSGVRPTGTVGALPSLLVVPFGTVLLVVLTTGIACFGMWRLVQTIHDTDQHGYGVRGLVIRTSLAAGAIEALLVGIMGISLTSGRTFPSFDTDLVRVWAARLLDWPFGGVALGAVGCVFGGAGVAVAIKGWSGSFQKRLTFSGRIEPWAHSVCRFGLIARGITLLMMGAYLIEAAIVLDIGEAQGLGGVLWAFGRHTHGLWLLGPMAAGLVAFGLYSLLEAAFRNLQASDPSHTGENWSQAATVRATSKDESHG